MNDLTDAVARTRARLAHGDSCHEHVMRGGRGEPCDKPAVALRDDTEADSYYPVCVRHARGFCIPVVDRFDLLALLDALDAAEATVQRVRELHSVISCGDTWCEHCPCRACGEGWPCTTIRSLDEESDDYPEPACLIHDITGEDVPGWEMAECTCPTIRPHVKADTPDPRLHVLARRLPDWPVDDLADLLAELDEAVTL